MTRIAAAPAHKVQTAFPRTPNTTPHAASYTAAHPYATSPQAPGCPRIAQQPQMWYNTFADLESRAHRRLRPVKPGGSTVTPEGEPYESRARLLFFCPAQCGSLRKFPIFSNVHFGQELSGLPQLRVSTGDAQGEVSAANAAAPYGRRRHTQHVPRTGLHQGCFTSRPPCSWLHF